MSILKISSFLTAYGAYGYYIRHKKNHGYTTTAKCCGIFGYIGSKNAQEVLMNGVKILQNRGYDSCGLSTLSPSKELYTAKFASCGSTCDCIDILSEHVKDNFTDHHIGIAHTRWATHGAKTDTNAHPHIDYKNRLSLVHNGTIINYQEIKNDLIAKGISFKSDTDSEVIINLISWLFDETKNLLQATSKALESLQGTWGLAIISKDCDQEIILARNGSPLIVGCSNNEVFVASEPSALAMYTNQFIELDDGEICVAKIDGIQNLVAKKDLHEVHADNFSLSPSPYDHWTLKEIMEQSETVERALNFGGRLHPVGYRVKLGGLEQSVNVVSQIQNLIITGCGTSFYAGMYGELLMHHLGCFQTVQTLDAAEMTSERFPRSSTSGVLLLSQSGETHDTIRVFRLAANLSIPCFSVVNCVGSHLARLTNCGVYLNAGREVAVASTKVFLSQVVVLSLIAAWWAQRHNISSDKCQTMMRSLCRLPLSINKLLKDHSPFKTLADTLKHSQNIFVLGKNIGYPIALEGALKIKEISYIHAEGFSSASLKHGPLALIDSHARSPVILICTGEREMSFLESTAEQLKARGAYVIAILEEDKTLNAKVDSRLFVPSNDIFSPLLAAVCLQTLAYYLALSRGINPDKPRSLAKTVTVS